MDFDVSVLFDSVPHAVDAWRSVLGATGAEWVISEGHFVAVATVSQAPLPTENLDTRLLPQPFELGAAFIGVTLGGTNQFQLRRELTNPATGKSAFPNPWGDGGVMKGMTSLVRRLLDAGGTAVVLHKAAGTVKASAMFLEELETERHSAWLDLTAAEDGHGGVQCRSYGMPHYFGSPNVRAVAPTADFRSIEGSMGVVRHVCRLIAEDNQNPYQITEVSMPEFRVAGKPVPAIDWRATYDDEQLWISLSEAS